MGARGPIASSKKELEASSIGVAPFDPPDDICSEARRQWDAYWADPVSQTPTRADRGLLLRWIEALNRFIVASREADKDMLSHGSTGQLVINPLYKIATDALAIVERCERQMGIGGKNRADLGIAIVAGKKSLDELNDRYEGKAASADGEDDDPEGDEADPRLVVVTEAGDVVAPRRRRPRKAT